MFLAQSGTTWHFKITERVAVDLSKFRNYGDSIGQVSWNRAENPPTHSLDIRGFPRISKEQMYLKLKEKDIYIKIIISFSFRFISSYIIEIIKIIILMNRAISSLALVFISLLNGCYSPTQRLVEEDCKDGFFKTNYYDSCMPKF